MRFFNLKLKLHKTIANTKFNIKYINCKITLKNYINITIKNNNEAGNIAKNKCIIEWLKNEIKISYNKKQNLNVELHTLHGDLIFKLGSVIFCELT